MGTEKPNIQDNYLNELRKLEMPVRVLFSSGKELQGIITGFDPFTFTLEVKGVELLVYKSAVAVIAPEAQHRPASTS